MESHNKAPLKFLLYILAFRILVMNTFTQTVNFYHCWLPFDIWVISTLVKSGGKVLLDNECLGRHVWWLCGFDVSGNNILIEN